MPLPILKVEHKPSPATLARYFHQCRRAWASHLADPSDLDFGTAFANAELARVWDCNAVYDARIPPDSRPDDVIASAREWFDDQQSHCCAWVMNPSAPIEQTRPLADALAARGAREWRMSIMHLAHLPALPLDERRDLTIIPARASYRHMQELAEEGAREAGEPQSATAQMLHLDDPHWDCLLAIKDARCVASVGVLAVGEIGMVENLFVTASQRRQRIGETMLVRALEICARSLFRHVFLSASPENVGAMKLYRRFGFEPIGDYVMHIHASP